MRCDHYILNAKGEPVIEPDLRTWAQWFENNLESRVVGRTEVVPGVLVSTVFLGLDHNWAPIGPPVLWETMVRRHGDWDEQTRCSGSREQAEAMHERMVKQVQQELTEKTK